MKFSRRDTLRATGLTAGAGLALHAGLLQAATKQRDPSDRNRQAYQPKKLIHGVAYYPELWPESDIERDIAEMQKLGINCVRMAEFAWSTLETEPGKISLDLFRRVMDRMHEAGIRVVLCTPTATPPRWLSYQHEDRLLVNADGETMHHGARQHISYEHPAVRHACLSIIKAMARELGNHPALMAWQLDNEMKAHVSEDYSVAAVANWHKWLKQRFGTIERLNQAWGTHMWSQHYQSFEQVPASVKTPFLHSASLSTAYRMFCRESIADFMQAQSNIIRQFSPHPITHNDNPAFSIHHERSMDALDFAAYDAYPTAEQWGALVFRSDMYRAAIPGRPFWLMETSTAHNGWLGNHQPPHPAGFLAAEAALVYGLGGEAFCYWLWRQQRSGAELPHSAVMSAWFKPGIGYTEVEKVSAMRKALEPHLLNTQVVTAEVAVTYSDHARAMIETESLDKREGFPGNYRGVIEWWQSRVRDLGFHRDVRFENADLDGLKLLITPAMPYVSEAFAERVLNFVRAGGTWIAGPVTGTRGREHTVPTTAGLGLLDELAGVTTEYVVPLTNTRARGSAFDMQAPLSGWCAAMRAKPGTRVEGKIAGPIAEGLAFVTERPLGKGCVVVLGAHPHGEEGARMIDRMIAHYARNAGVTQRYEVSPGTLVCPRVDDQGHPQWFVINMDGNGGGLKLPGKFHDAITGKSVGNELTLERYQWRLLRANKRIV